MIQLKLGGAVLEKRVRVYGSGEIFIHRFCTHKEQSRGAGTHRQGIRDWWFFSYLKSTYLLVTYLRYIFVGKYHIYISVYTHVTMYIHIFSSNAGYLKFYLTTRRLVWITASLGGRAHFTFRQCLGGLDWLARCGHWSRSALHILVYNVCMYVCRSISMHVCF